MKSKLTVGQWMTVCPKGIEPHQSMRIARQRMREMQVHHLPVQAGGVLVGILSDRDIELIASLPELGPWEKVTVEEAMTPEPYIVSVDQPLNEVLKEMVKHRYGCALVADAGKHLQGIFTYTDAMKLLAEMTS